MCDQQRLWPACAYVQSDQSLCLSFEYSMTVKLLAEHHLEFLSLKGGCAPSSESTLVKMSHCWKSHVTAQILCEMDNDWPGFMVAMELGCLPSSLLILEKSLQLIFYTPAHVLIEMSCDMWFPTMWHFDRCRLRRACASSFKVTNSNCCSVSSFTVIEYSRD